MSMTPEDIAEQRWEDRRRERTCAGCPQRHTSYCDGCLEGREDEESGEERETNKEAK